MIIIKGIKIFDILFVKLVIGVLFVCVVFIKLIICDRRELLVFFLMKIVKLFCLLMLVL